MNASIATHPAPAGPPYAVDLLILDLDGTLVDATDDITAAVNHALAGLDRPPLPRAEIAAHVGHGVRSLMQSTLNADAATFERALQSMLAYYYDHCLDGTRLYPGVLETLNKLKGGGKRLAVCTNKTLRHSQKILEGLGVAPLLEQVIGGNSMAEKKPHPMGVEKILADAGVSRARAVMVGDSAVDVETGRRAGMLACGVTYGLRPVDEIVAAAPDCIIDCFAELAEYFY